MRLWVCKYCISKPYPLLALCIFFPAARNQGPPPHPPGTVGHKRHPGHFATTLLQLCYNLWYHLTPRGPHDTMLQLCYNFATTYGTTWPQEAPRTPCYHFATTLLQLCYHLCYHLAPRGPQDTMLQLCYNFATTYATTWPQEAPSFNRELSPKSCLKKHPLNDDFWGDLVK